MSIRAKFRCHSTTAYDPAHGYAGTGVLLHAVYGNGSDNAAWSKATPQGKVDLTITVPEAAAAFVPGQEYWLDFTPVAAAPAADALLVYDYTEPVRTTAVSADAGNLVTVGSDGLLYLSAAALKGAIAPPPVSIAVNGVDGTALGVMQAPEVAAAPRDYPDEIQVGDVIDPVPEAGHDGPQYVTGVTQHPDGTALELRPATPEEIAAAPSTGTYTSDGGAQHETVTPESDHAPARGWVDPVKEAQARDMRVNPDLSTLTAAPSPDPAPAQAA